LLCGFSSPQNARGGAGGGGSRGIFNFGKSRAKLINESSHKITSKMLPVQMKQKQGTPRNY